MMENKSSPKSSYGSAGDWSNVIQGISQGAGSAMQASSASNASKKDIKEAKRRTLANILNYEGMEHIKYKNPGYSRHNIRIPQDEPHMKSHVSREEEHEMEDNYHMGVPNQTKYELEAKIKRARMKMDAPDQEDPDELRGNMVHNVPYEGDEDTSGEEEMGPNDMQSGMSKERRKKMIVAVTKRKMQRRK